MAGPFKVGIEGSYDMTWIMHSLRALLQINTKINMM